MLTLLSSKPPKIIVCFENGGCNDTSIGDYIRVGPITGVQLYSPIPNTFAMLVGRDKLALAKRFGAILFAV